MTFIEFFDKTCVENICVCLSAMPERVIFLGDKKRELEAHANRYEKLFSERGQTVSRQNRQLIKKAIPYTTTV